MLRAAVAPWLASCMFLLLGHASYAAKVELSEVLPFDLVNAWGEYSYDVYPIDNTCNGDLCVGRLTRDGSLDLESRYGCTRPQQGDDRDDDAYFSSQTCSVTYDLSEDYSIKASIAGVKIALHPDSITKLSVLVDGEVVVQEWDAVAGSSEVQDIPGLEGAVGATLAIKGVMDFDEYFAVLEVEIYLTVDEVPVAGVSASSRAAVSATATVDDASAMNTLDGDATDSSSWTCSSGEVCDIIYDLGGMESLQQLRIAFSEDTSAGGKLNIMAADDLNSSLFFPVKAGIEAGDGERPPASDGLQTFGGVRALARYVKIEAVPASGGKIGINEVDLRVREDAPAQPVAEKKWLKETGMLPLGGHPSSSAYPNFDIRAPADGGCDSPAHFEGCHIYYVKDGDMDSRWSCSLLSTGSLGGSDEDCQIEFSLNYYRYVRQIKLAFHMGDERYYEFSIEAYTVLNGWVTVVPSAIGGGGTTDYQTFDVDVHANVIRLVPLFTRYDEEISVTEMVILEMRKEEFVAGTLPVFEARERFNDDDADFSSASAETVPTEVPTHFKFDIPAKGDYVLLSFPNSAVTAVRMRFPAGRKFVFSVRYGLGRDFDYEDASEEFTSAGGERTWENFALSPPAGLELDDIDIVAVSGPSVENHPDYPTLRVGDLQVVGEVKKPVGYDTYLNMVTTTMTRWAVIPDIIGDGVSEQEDIMAAICEAKGAAFDGIDCVGDLNDASLYLDLRNGDYFVDGPVFLKSGVTLSGTWSGDNPNLTYFELYEGANIGKTSEDAMFVIDGVVGGKVEWIMLRHKTPLTGDIVPGSIGNLCLEIRDSEDVYFDEVVPNEARTGAVRITDSRNISSTVLWEGEVETGNYMELTRVDDFHVKGFPDMTGLLIDTCNNILFEGWDEFEVPTARLSPPTGGDQEASVVITGESSEVVFQNCYVEPGADPRILIESTEPVTLDNIIQYEEAVSGDCIVEVPEGTGDDFIVQVKTNPGSYSTDDGINQLLMKSGSCWILE